MSIGLIYTVKPLVPDPNAVETETTLKNYKSPEDDRDRAERTPAGSKTFSEAHKLINIKEELSQFFPPNSQANILTPVPCILYHLQSYQRLHNYIKHNNYK